MDSLDLRAVWLTFKLAGLTTVLLLLIGTPLAWWLARTRSRLKGVVGAVVALPLVLPPTVLGFYLLVALGPHGPLGRLERQRCELRPGIVELLAQPAVIVDQRRVVEDQLLAHDALERGCLFEQQPAGARGLRRLQHFLAALRCEPVDGQQELGERVQERQAHQQERQQDELEERARVIHVEPSAAIIDQIMTPPCRAARPA